MGKKDYKECPACAEWVRAQARICRFCGAVLDQGELPAFVPQAQRELDTEIAQSIEHRFADLGIELSEHHRRRIIEFLKSSDDQYRSATVMFADLTGYTKIVHRTRPEYVQEFLGAFYRFFTQTIELYNGFIVHFAGDGGLAVFGAPLAFERDAEAAIRAAIDIRERLRAMPVLHGIKVRISLGLATGDILSSIVRGQLLVHYNIFGDAVNLAARIETAAEPDTIVIDPATHELTRNAFDFRPIAPRSFKNVEKSLATYEVLDLAGAGQAKSADRTPFVGRAGELAQIEKIWAQFRGEAKPVADEAPAPGIILLGKAGIGKTKLAEEFLARCKEKPAVLHVENAPYEAKIPWKLWRAVLSAIWNGSPLDAPDRVRPALRGELKRLGFKGNQENTLGLLLGLPESVAALSALKPDLLKRQIAADLRGILEALAREKPLILRLDDLQWADASSLAILNRLIAEGAPAGVFFLLIHRAEFDLGEELKKNLALLPLNELDQASRQVLFNLMADVREFQPELREAILRQDTGNPLYLLELIRSIQSQIAAGNEEFRDLTPRRLEQWVPPSLKQMLQARIDQLDQHRKDVLQCGAVLGRRFALRIIDLFEHIRRELLSKLYSLKSLEFFSDLPLPDGLEFLFRQQMTREVAYQALLDTQRTSLHRMIAEQIETRAGELKIEATGLLAYHFSRSGQEDKALLYLARAGDQAAAAATIDEALEYYQDALKLLKKMKPLKQNRAPKIKILQSMGRLYRLTGDQSRAMANFTEARKLARGGDALTLARLGCEMGLTYLQTSEYAKAQRELSRTLIAARRLKDENLVAQATLGLGNVAWGRGDLAQAGLQYRNTIALTLDGANKNTAADTFNNLAMVEWRQGRLASAGELLRSALKLRRQAGDRFGIALTRMNLGIIEENLGRFGAAERNYREALGEAEQIRFSQVSGACYANLANLLLNQDRCAEALDQSARSLEIALKIGDRRSAAIAYENLALSHLGSVRFADCRNELTLGQKLARKIGDRERLFSLMLVEIEMMLRQKNLKDAAKWLAAAGKECRTGGFEAERLRLLRLEIEHMRATGRMKDGEKACQGALALARRQGNRPELRRLLALHTSLTKAPKIR